MQPAGLLTILTLIRENTPTTRVILTHLYPYWMLSPQPPQIQACLRSEGRLALLQPQLSSWPSLQPRDTLCTTPALATAWANAASLDAAGFKNSYRFLLLRLKKVF